MAGPWWIALAFSCYAFNYYAIMVWLPTFMVGERNTPLGTASLLTALMVAANILFAFNDVWLRRIADDIGIIQTVWGRSVLFLAIMLVTMRRGDWAAALAPLLFLIVVVGWCVLLLA